MAMIDTLRENVVCSCNFVIDFCTLACNALWKQDSATGKHVLMCNASKVDITHCCAPRTIVCNLPKGNPDLLYDTNAMPYIIAKIRQKIVDIVRNRKASIAVAITVPNRLPSLPLAPAFSPSPTNCVIPFLPCRLLIFRTFSAEKASISPSKGIE